MKFADKMKDVELNPYMLAIYKDNEHHHLLKHALECWEFRTRNGTKTALRPFDTNPILFCRYPPLELIEAYNLAHENFIQSRLLECPKVAKWALRQMMAKWAAADMEIFKLNFSMAASNPYRVLSLIEYDEELIYEVIMAGFGPVMPDKFQQSLNTEQRMTMTICA